MNVVSPQAKTLLQFSLSNFPRGFAAGVPEKKKDFRAYEGTKETRKELMRKIYEPFRQLEEYSDEWIKLAQTGSVWRNFYSPFDLTNYAKWGWKNETRLARIDQLARFLDPLPLSDPFKIALSHQSVRIEGYRLTPGESEGVYETIKELTNSFTDKDSMYVHPPSASRIIKDSQLDVGVDDVIMIRNNFIAQEFVFNHMIDKDISESDIKHLHKLMLKDSQNDVKTNYSMSNKNGKTLNQYVIGDYREFMTQATGCPHTVYPSPLEVPVNMKMLLEHCKVEAAKPTIHKLVYASYFYATFLHIHPFFDGNGRIARLLFAVAMLRLGMPPVIFQNFDRDEYINALYLATSEGNPDSWLEMICSAVEENVPRLTEEM
jgi:hypothetical protein